MLRPLLFVLAVNSLYQKIKKENFDVVFSHNGGYPAAELCLGAVLAAKLARVPRIYLIIHNYPQSFRLPFKYWDLLVDRLISRSCQEIISVSNDCARQIQTARFPERKVKVIYNGIVEGSAGSITLAQKRQRLKIDIANEIIGAIGDYEERKGYDYLIKAFADVIEVFPNAKLVIIGNPEPAHLIVLTRLIRELNLINNVILTGYLENAWEYVECFDVLVLPSVRHESFGLALVEAMLAHCPVIGTKLGGIPEVISNAGILVEPENSAELAQAIIMLLNSSVLRRIYGDKGYERAKALFMASRMAKEYCDLTR